MTAERRENVRGFLHHLTAAVANAALYSLEHAQMTRLVHATAESLRALLEGQEEFVLMRVDSDLVIDDQAWERGAQTERLAELLRRRGIGRIRIGQAIATEEIRQLIAALAACGPSPSPVRSTANLRFGRIEVRRRAERSGGGGAADGPFADLTREELARLMDIYGAVKRRQKLNVVGLTDIVSQFVEAFSREADPFLALAPLRTLDEYTFTHASNVAMLNLAQALALGIEGPLLHDIGVAGLLHDVGKLFIPEAVLNKPDPLDAMEWEIVRQHPLQGARYLLNSPGVPRIAVVSAFEHHLRFDQRGYPDIHNEWSQNLCSQITAISDLFDSMMTQRPYRDAQPLREVVATMQKTAGRELHPQLTRNFLHILYRAKKRADSAA